MAVINITSVIRQEFYVVNRAIEELEILAGPFYTSERANEQKRRLRREGIGGAMVLLAPRSGNAKEVLS